MAIVMSPNQKYTGVSAGVAFANGKGETDNPHLLEWFYSRGYTVEGAGEDPPSGISPEDLEKIKAMDANALLAYAAEKNIDLGNASSQAGYLKKIMDALKAGQA